MLPSSSMKRWLAVLILCAAPLAEGKPNNTLEAAKVLDGFLQGTVPLNQAINRVQFLGEEPFVSMELVQAFRRAQGKIRGQILEFLAALAFRHEDVEAVFLKALSSDDVGEMMNGARGLGRLKSQTIKPLISLLDSPLLGPRREAARALGEIGKPAAAAPLLKAAKKEADLDLRLLMIASAGRSGDKKQIPAFEALLKDDSESTRLAAAKALCMLGAPRCLQFAGTLLASKDRNERFQGVMLFEGAPSKTSAAILKPVLLETDDKLRARAARILVQGGDLKALDWLVIESTKAEVMTLLRSTVRPEFLNRVDEIIMFEPLTMKDVRAIVQLQLDMLMNKLAEKDYQLIPSAELVNHISEQGYDPQFGARPIKRMIQKELMNELSRQIIAGSVETAVKLVIDVFDGKIVFRKPIDEQEKNGKMGQKAKAGV